MLVLVAGCLCGWGGVDDMVVGSSAGWTFRAVRLGGGAAALDRLLASFISNRRLDRFHQRLAP
jgi:hypothetical protein